MIIDPTTLQIASVLRAFGFRFALGGDGVGGFAGLGDQEMIVSGG